MEAGVDGVRFGFPEYIRTFLERLGVDDVDIYDRFRGRQVLRYQAVVQLQAWERAWAKLEPAFRAQRAAYRRQHGGKNAPEISIGRPRFVPSDDAASAAVSSDSSESGSSILMPRDDNYSGVGPPILNTFIHFPERVSMPRRRALTASL